MDGLSRNGCAEPAIAPARCFHEPNELSGRRAELLSARHLALHQFVKGTFEQRGSVCSGVKLPASSIMSSLYALDSGYTATSDVIGKYRLIDYQFIGDSYQGGVATIKVQGQRISKDVGKCRDI